MAARAGTSQTSIVRLPGFSSMTTLVRSPSAALSVSGRMGSKVRVVTPMRLSIPKAMLRVGS